MRLERTRTAFCRNTGAALAALLVVPLVTDCGMRPALAAGDVLQSLRGHWVAPGGTVTGNDGPPLPAEVELQPADGGFSLKWSVPGVPTELAFAPTSGRAGVLAGPGAEGWSMFGGDKPVNPLRKGTLFWGRSAPEAIYVYSLAVDDRGAFMLDRYAFRPAGERLQLALERRLSQGKVEQAEASLERKDR